MVSEARVRGGQRRNEPPSSECSGYRPRIWTPGMGSAWGQAGVQSREWHHARGTFCIAWSSHIGQDRESQRVVVDGTSMGQHT